MARVGKLGAPTGDDSADARAELRWAMSGAGLTPDRLPLMPAVLRLPSLRQALAGVPPEDVPRVALATVADATHRLGGGFRARLLRRALAVDYDGVAKDLTARRTELVRECNDEIRRAGDRNLVPESPRALYEIERQTIEALVTLLGVTPAVPVPAGPAARTCGHASLDATCRFTGRHVGSVETLAVIRAFVDGVTSFPQTYYCSREGGVEGRLSVLEGGVLAANEQVGRPNFRVATIELPRALRAGDTHRLRFDVTYPGRAESEPWFSVHVVHPVDFVAVRLSFDPESLPADVWRMDRVPSDAHRGNRESAMTLVPDRFGYVEAEFVQPDVPFSYGIAWEW